MERRQHWRMVTDDFDIDSIKDIINTKDSFEGKLDVAVAIQDSFFHSGYCNGKDVDEVQPILDLLTLYQFKEGTQNYNMWKKRVDYRIRELRKKIKQQNTSLQQQVKALTEKLKKESENYRLLQKEIREEPREAFNQQTSKKCLTSTQMGILMQAVGEFTEERVPGKTTLGNVVENIAGYSATTVNQNMKGIHREIDKKAVAEAVESKFPRLAEKVRKL